MKNKNGSTSGEVSTLVGMLTESDSRAACAACDRLVEISRESSVCYEYFDCFSEMLRHKNSLVRNRAMALICACSAWDGENKTEKIIDEFLTHICDEKPITSRQCIKALPGIAENKPRLKKKIVCALKSADASRYADSMRPLIERDICGALEKIES